MYNNEESSSSWRGGTYLVTASNSFEADIIESKLRGEDIPCLKKYIGASNILEIVMGANFTSPIDIYVPMSALEDSKNIIREIPVDEDAEPVDDGRIQD